jgi:hypothetical protein
LPGAIGREVNRQIAAGLTRNIEQEACQVITESGLGAGNRGLRFAESVQAAWAERLRLQQVSTRGFVPLNPPLITTPTKPLVNWLTFTPGTPIAVEAVVP